MRQLIILLAIIFTAACSYGQSPISQPASSQATDQKPVLVDIVIHNDSTNDFFFKFDTGPDAFVPVKLLAGGETITNKNVPWDFWPSVVVDLGENGTLQFLNVSLNAVNEQLSPGNHQIFIRLTDPEKLEMTCGGASAQIFPTTAKAVAQPVAPSDGSSASDHDQATNPVSDRKAGRLFVDILIQNDSTNDFNVILDDLGILPQTISAGQTATNTHIEWFNNLDTSATLSTPTGQIYLQDNISFEDLNKQLASGKCRQVVFRILDPGKVEVTSSEAPTQNLEPATTPAASQPVTPPDPSPIVVDVAVYNDTTDACSIVLDDYGNGPKLPPVSLPAGGSATNANVVWTFSPDMGLDYTINETGRKHSADISFTAINAQMSAEKKHYQVNLHILGPLHAEATCQ